MLELFLAGGPVMWPLLALSLVSLTVIIERLTFWLRKDIARNRQALEDLLEAVRLDRGPDEAHKSSGHEGSVCRMLLSGLAHRDFSSTKAMETVALEELKHMRRGMSVLDTIITAAPMLGILGTVTGIISSFNILGQMGVQEPQAVVSGIAQALITTAAGLIISIVTVFPFNYFNARIDDAEQLFEHYATRLEILQDMPRDKAEHSSPAGLTGP